MWMLLSDAPPVASGLNMGLLLLVSAGAIWMSGVLSSFRETTEPARVDIDEDGIGDDEDETEGGGEWSENRCGQIMD